MIGYQNFGDAAILLTFGEVYTEKVQLEVRAWAAHLRKVNLSYVADLIPAYTTLTILYKPSEISYEELLGVLKGMKVEPGVSRTGTSGQNSGLLRSCFWH